MTRKNLLLTIGLSIPVLMIIIIGLGFFLSNFFYHPQFNFIYALDRQYWGDQYFVNKDKIMLQKAQRLDGQLIVPSSTQLFLYDVKKDLSQSILFEQAQQMHLDANPISPDGYQVKAGKGAEVIIPLFFVSGDSSGIYLDGRYGSRKLKIGTYQNSNWGFHFIGWIVNGK